MTSPKRAEPANEIARDLLYIANCKEMFDAAAEIERLAARVRELEGREPAEIDLLERDLVSMARLLGRAKAAERPWLPIASAPRDGTRVELWHKAESRATYGSFAAGRWCAECEIYQEIDFTHWRREPAGPESKPDQETKGIEMIDGQRVQVRLHSDSAWYDGTVIKARKQWVELDQYHRPGFIADENSIAEWRVITPDSPPLPSG